jgi:hypothetical protein
MRGLSQTTTTIETYGKKRRSWWSIVPGWLKIVVYVGIAIMILGTIATSFKSSD